MSTSKMVSYICPLCDKVYTHKQDYIKHTRRKKPCNKNGKKQIGGSPPELSEAPPKLSKIEKTIEKENHICYYCKNEFSNKYNLNRHINLVCKIKKQHEKEKEEKYNELIQRIENNEKNTENNNKIFEEEINQLRNQLNEEKEKNNKLNQIIHKQINKTEIENQNVENLTNNVTINLNLQAFGREDMNKIDDKYIIEALKRGIASVPLLTERVHLNIKYPEFNNVYIPSTTHSHAMVFNGEKWELKDKNETIDNLYDNKYNFLEEKFEEICEDENKNKEISESHKKSFKRFIKIQEEAEADSNVNSKKIVKDIKKKMKYVLCNKKDIPINNYNKIKKNNE